MGDSSSEDEIADEPAIVFKPTKRRRTGAARDAGSGTTKTMSDEDFFVKSRIVVEPTRPVFFADAANETEAQPTISDQITIDEEDEEDDAHKGISRQRQASHVEHITILDDAGDTSSRQRSVTPPPEFDPAQFDASIRSHLDDLITDRLERASNGDAAMSSGAGQGHHTLPNNTSTPALPRSKNAAQIHLTIHFVADPRENKPKVRPSEKLRVAEDASFQQIIEQLCQTCLRRKSAAARALPILTPNDVILEDATSKARLFRSGTPKSLGMANGAICNAYTKQVYDVVQAMRRKTEQDRSASFDDDALDIKDNALDSDDDMVDDTLYLKLRAKDGSDVKMSAKPTTTVETILHHYATVKHLSSAQRASLTLLFDDEALDPQSTLVDTDIESGDMLIVKE
ncbi:hypothetical protein BZG36_01706 [Bifiguratus adelaidae]|uniref:Ubiquitin-like domain-containing protein n=1 Tax=Bifiguratus adelaidae TaxID=1938954 RepID=A0A261Y4M9_9FUNG|nr:hypothetical protein BZG36_01706 [Bifiguratus adelaidae]